MCRPLARSGDLLIFWPRKVYYFPFLPFHDNCPSVKQMQLFLNSNFCLCIRGTFPTFLSFFPLIRKVLIRERIDIVHGHQATSNLAHEQPGCSERRPAVHVNVAVVVHVRLFSTGKRSGACSMRGPWAITPCTRTTRFSASQMLLAYTSQSWPGQELSMCP